MASPIHHPKAKFLRRPREPEEMCRRCGHNKKCKIEDGPWVYSEESDNFGEFSPIICANIRCEDGKKAAKNNIKTAIKMGDLILKKTPDGKKVYGTDATYKKRGFVDKEGNLYIYKDHNWDSSIVLPTGQKIELPKSKRKSLSV